MPWTSRPSRRTRLRRWRYDHSQTLVAFWIGVGVVAAALALILALRALT